MFGKIKITNFGMRHFDKKFSGTKITDKTIDEFEEFLNLRVVDSETTNNGNQKFRVKIMDGYAPFCKLIAIENFTNAKVGSLPIDISNYQYLRHGYSSRAKDELPVLSRWFEIPLPSPVATYLVVVVYSKEQIIKEAEVEIEKTGGGGWIDPPDFDAEWGVVAILGQTHPNEEPMNPITMMRNALGMSEGGSGVPINKEKYLESVEFWKNSAIVKS